MPQELPIRNWPIVDNLCYEARVVKSAAAIQPQRRQSSALATVQ